MKNDGEQMEESQPPRPTLVVERFIDLRPHETCGSPPADLPLCGPRWNLVQLGDTSVSESTTPRHPYSPDVANAFFRSGEIESWGRGIEKIFSACRKADSPPPEIHVDGYDLWVEFQFSRDYLAGFKSGGVLDDKEKSSGKSSEIILKLLAKDSHLTIPELAEKMNISTRAVEKHLQKLREADKLKRIGPTRGGHWEVRSAKDPGGNADG